MNHADNILAIPDFDGNKVTFFTGVYSGIDHNDVRDSEEIRICGNELIVSSSEPCLSVSRKMFWRTDKNL